MAALLTETARTPVMALFSICAAVAALEALVREEPPAAAFRTLCALAASVCALRVIMPLLG